MTPEVCPNCGADVPRGARACPDCGADEQTGWSDQAQSSSLDLPGEQFDYTEFVEREFGPPSVKPRRLAWLWWLAAVILVLLLLAFWFH